MVVNDKGNGFCLVLLGKATACRAHSFFSRLNRAANPCVHQTGNGPWLGRWMTSRLADLARRAGTAISCRRMVAVVALAWKTDARVPAARVRLNAIAANANQALFAGKDPEGSC